MVEVLSRSLSGGIARSVGRARIETFCASQRFPGGAGIARSVGRARIETVASFPASCSIWYRPLSWAGAD